MPAHTSATVRRRLGSRLRSLREQLGETVEQLADRLAWPTARIREIERGLTWVSADELRVLLGLLRAPEAQSQELLTHTTSTPRVEWGRYKGLLSRQYLDYVTLEEVSSVMRQYNACLIPGLLQTEAYIREIYRHLRGSTDGEEVIEQLVTARLERQRLLTADGRPELRIILDESTLHRSTAAPDDMVDQLQHLQRIAGTDRVSIQILPLNTGLHGGLMGSFNLLEFAESNADWVLFFESSSGDEIERDCHGGAAAHYFRLFDQLEAVSLAGQQMQDRLEQIIATHRGRA